MTFEEACRPGRPLFPLDVSHPRKLQMFFSTSKSQREKCRHISKRWCKLDLTNHYTSSNIFTTMQISLLLVSELKYHRVKVHLKCKSPCTLFTSDKYGCTNAFCNQIHFSINEACTVNITTC